MSGPAPLWYRRLGVEVRNVVIAVVLGVIVLAAVLGAVIGLTAVTVH